ncbi:hypothetical protein HMPREF9057_00738 [Actinomyces sp. oral taxon 171 str. F0337]|nr:hypothetical protein HMPREF9057_00738 [Actinomyces sp. oral taxon 171 str. F0337]
MDTPVSADDFPLLFTCASRPGTGASSRTSGRRRRAETVVLLNN